ncbi:hypothetical protein [Paraglaciecola arctica]|uniref:hypothetical protein n=1 Tax=Paraglaciecola arctica TaxID=1128911 RepID=UPI0013BEA72D|nr:hypothetical protein [Paraglaciecola arctica]
MKRIIGERRQASGLYPDGPMFKERRKAYYHGKYSKRMLSLLLLVSCVALIIFKQVA